MDKLVELLGRHEWQIIKNNEHYSTVVPDIEYIVKAIVLIVCLIWLLKGFFSLIKSLW